jgi:Thrombospondin type 3 repeat
MGVLFMLLVVARTDTAYADFNPVLEVTLEATDPETPTNTSISFGISNNKDVNFGGVVAFIPSDFGIVRGDRLPIGEPVGELDAIATLGLINSACNQALAVHFDFVNASLDQTETVSFDDLEAEAGDTTAEGFGEDDFSEDKDGNGLFDSIDHWPEFITRVTGDVQPFRRSAGIATVAGIPVLLQFLIYDVGTEFDLPGEDLERLLPKDPALGFPTIVLLQNVGDPDIDPEPGPITDFCTPLQSNNTAYGTSLDADKDGTANGLVQGGVPKILDTCPYEAHEFLGNHDEDFDFLHSQCDPDDSDATGKNEDQNDDGVENFADNCAIDANQDQADGDEDFIGDACDENPTEQDGEIILGMLPQAGNYKYTVFTVGQRDADNDGYMNSMDTCPFVANSGSPIVIAGGDADQDGMDAACDPNDDLTAGGANSDVDGDGYLNRQDNCPLITNGQESSDDPTGNQNDEDFDTIGDVCDPDPIAPDGELIDKQLVGDIVIGGGGAGGPPSEEKCPDCFRPGDPPFEQTEGTEAAEASPTVENGGDDGGSNTGLIIAIIAGVAAAVVVIGGGAFLLSRRGGGG